MSCCASSWLQPRRVSWRAVKRDPRPSSTHRIDSASTSVASPLNTSASSSTSSIVPAVAYGPRRSTDTVAVAADHDDAEADRRAVALADLADAEHDAQLTGRQPALVGCRHGARVAHRGRLDRELLGERGAEQQPALLGQLDVRRRAGSARRRGVAVEHRGEIAVAAAEPLDDLVERGGDVGVAQPEDVGDGVRRPSLALAGEGVAGDEQLTEHARRIRQQLDRAARRARRRRHATAAMARACCSVVISARVDSVPSLRLTPSTLESVVAGAAVEVADGARRRRWRRGTTRRCG